MSVSFRGKHRNNSPWTSLRRQQTLFLGKVHDTLWTYEALCALGVDLYLETPKSYEILISHLFEIQEPV